MLQRTIKVSRVMAIINRPSLEPLDWLWAVKSLGTTHQRQGTQRPTGFMCIGGPQASIIYAQHQRQLFSCASLNWMAGIDRTVLSAHHDHDDCLRPDHRTSLGHPTARREIGRSHQQPGQSQAKSKSLIDNLLFRPPTCCHIMFPRLWC